MSYYKKYLKYKNKYIQLNHNLQQKGGANINDNVYDNSHKYLGSITDIKEGLYICHAYDGEEFILKLSGEGRLWYAKKQEKDIIDLFGYLSTSTGIDKIYQLVNVNDSSDVLEIRGDAPLKPIKDNNYKLYKTFHQIYLFINSLPNESSSGYYNLFFNNNWYQLVKLDDNIYLVNDNFKYTIKLILTVPKLDKPEDLFKSITPTPTVKSTPSLYEMMEEKRKQINTDAQIKKVKVGIEKENIFIKDLSTFEKKKLNNF